MSLQVRIEFMSLGSEIHVDYVSTIPKCMSLLMSPTSAGYLLSVIPEFTCSRR